MLAEQEERRRVAELLHDGPIQQLSAISQMLDAGLGDLEERRTRARRGCLFPRARARARRGARPAGSSATTSSRECCISSALRRQPPHSPGARFAIRGRDRPRRRLADELGENAAVALYQILREATEQAMRRGPLTRIEISAPRHRRTAASSSSSPTTARPNGAQRCSSRSRSGPRRSTAASVRRSATRVALPSGSTCHPQRPLVG